ncbi:hypothetical protein NEILACOT_05139 [Neisseria lactamica ATCC 23970]|uniref:Uncharacterized protein n=1 Tax=Neisseria lactamica ATCC 23970 TaxID=546265 RepID=D0WC59_NEILA|nr:hypothetical protein NEILACOT_05139 [Neisseria lactamica ATCC 23970]KFJ36650.1 hypothetical protein DR91_1275 [Neisseria lactamica ATCC 23970]CBX21604.1 unnamed protein product [Neisseria lactamica Y92-1009]SUA16172.1 Uncharacterised protein [Neisseria lactamica]VTQ49109.1 Uncharacterised protein [Neisseria lactamica]
MQKRIDEIQSKYREWCHLLPQLEEDIRRWKHAAALIRDMDNFYTHEYQACHQAIEDGAELDLRTEGEYSIMRKMRYGTRWANPINRLGYIYAPASMP